MSRVKLNIASQFYPGFEKTEIQLAEKCTLYHFLEQWSAEYAPGLIEKIFHPETRGVREGILILVNGKALRQTVAHKFLIAPGDTVAILPIIVGG